MDTKNLLLSYLKRLAKQTFTRLMLIADIISFGLWFYPSIQLSPIIPLILLTVTIVISGYLVFVEVSKEHSQEVEDLKNRLYELESKSPDIRIGFQAKAGVTEKLTLKLKPLPPKPDCDALVEQERNRQLAKREIKNLDEIIDFVRSLKTENPDFEEEVEDYLWANQLKVA